MASILEKLRGTDTSLQQAQDADEILAELNTDCWEALGKEGEPPKLTCDRLWFSLPSELFHHDDIRSALDGNLGSWQGSAYFHLFECFRAIGLDVRKATLAEWENIDIKESDSPKIRREKMKKLDEAVYFVFDIEALLFSETPDWIANILSINNLFTKTREIKIDLHKTLINEYSEAQRQCANFERLYINLSSLIHYITQHYTTRSRTNTTEPQTVKEVSLRLMNEKIESLHSFWQFCYNIENSLSHPLAPIIKAWLQAQIPEVEPDRRPTQIIPGFLRETQIDLSDSYLPVGQFHEGGEVQGWLPGFENNQSMIVPALPLEIYESAEGSPAPGGSGAPLGQRIFIHALLAFPYGKRQRDGSVKLNTSLRDIRDWAYPNGWTRKYDLPRIINALDEVHNMRIRWERRRWNVVQVFGLPDSNIKLDDLLPLRVEYPEGVSGNGPMIDIIPLRLYGTSSAPKFRAWIRLPYLWDDAKIRSGGFRIYATRPKVLRNSDGYLIDARGKVICTGELYSTSWGWKFRDGNIPQRAWYHPLAIQTGQQERNPEADKVPVLFNHDMIHLFFDNQRLTPSTSRKRLQLARDAAEEMEKEGRIVIETDQVDARRGTQGWRILQPRPK